MYYNSRITVHSLEGHTTELIEKVKDLLHSHGYTVGNERWHITQQHIPWWEAYSDIPPYDAKKLLMPLEYTKEGKRIGDIDVYILRYQVKISRYERRRL